MGRITDRQLCAPNQSPRPIAPDRQSRHSDDCRGSTCGEEGPQALQVDNLCHQAGTAVGETHLPHMPRFYFHVINDIDAPDQEGQELDTLAAANLKAIDYARDLASAAVRQGRLDLTHRIEIEAEDREILLTVTFADAIEVSR